MNLNKAKISFQPLAKDTYNSVELAYGKLSNVWDFIENLSKTNTTICKTAIDNKLRMTVGTDEILDKFHDSMFAYAFRYIDMQHLMLYHDAVKSCALSVGGQSNADMVGYQMYQAIELIQPYNTKYNLDFTEYTRAHNNIAGDTPKITIGITESRSFFSGLIFDYFERTYDYIYGGESAFSRMKFTRENSYIIKDVEKITGKKFSSVKNFLKYEIEQRKLYWRADDNDYEDCLKPSATSILFSKYFSTTETALPIAVLAGLEEYFKIISDIYTYDIAGMKLAYSMLEE